VAPEIDPNVLKALAHPLRFRVLVALDRRVASPNELARELEQPLGRISHHVRVLARLGAIELVDTRPRRGAIEHFYRATARPLVDGDVWAALPLAARRSIAGEALPRALADAAEAAAGRGFDDPLMHVSYTLLELDRQGREEVAAVLASALDEILAIRARAGERVARDGAADPTEVVMLHFDRPAD
jgi:DNA-binding transcriptional ArsR family regulator